MAPHPSAIVPRLRLLAADEVAHVVLLGLVLFLPHAIAHADHVQRRPVLPLAYSLGVLRHHVETPLLPAVALRVLLVAAQALPREAVVELAFEERFDLLVQ